MGYLLIGITIAAAVYWVMTGMPLPRTDDELLELSKENHRILVENYYKKVRA